MEGEKGKRKEQGTEVKGGGGKRSPKEKFTTTPLVKRRATLGHFTFR